MSVICGIWGAGHGAAKSDLDLMMRTPAFSLGDKTATWHGDGIAIGQLTLHITPESFNENLPLHKSELNLCIAGDIRLDNRRELFTGLGIKPNEQPGFGDARLIIAAYSKWGEHCPEHLLGDFSFALWDATREKLFCCVDHFGNRGLFYFYDGKRFIFSSTPNHILAVKSVPNAINYNKLSALVVPGAGQLFSEESWFRDIFPVPSATILTIDKNGVGKRKYWEPGIKKELSFKNEAQYAEAFQEVIFRAVGDRLRSHFPVTALLSGGLDSSAVVSVAAKILEKQNKELQVFSAVLPDENDPVLQDERYFIDLFKAFPNVNINYITAPGKGFFSDMEPIKTNVFGPNLISRRFLNQAFIDKALSIGSRVILEGSGGELGATFYGDGGYAEMFCRLKWARLWHEVNARKALGAESIRYNLYYNVAKPLLPGFLSTILQSRRKAFPQVADHCLRDDFAAMLMQRLGPRINDVGNFSPAISAEHRQNQQNLILARQAKARGKSTFTEGEFRSPLMDVRLLEFCLAAPFEYKIKDGYQRYMVRAGLHNILPREIQWRNSKTPFSPDYIRRYNSQLPEVRAFLDAITPGDPVREIVDIERLKTWLDIPVADHESGTFAETIARDHVPQGIYLIEFLRRFPEFKI